MPDLPKIEDRGREYPAIKLLARGDFCDLYLCHIDNKASRPAVLKVVRSDIDNDLLENEVKVLSELYPSSQDDVDYFRYVPKFLASGVWEGLQVLVIPLLDKAFSLSDVLKAYPNGLDFRDVAWIHRRMLVGLGWAHQRGFIHGAVVPSNVMIYPHNHGARIIDWSYSITKPVDSIEDALGEDEASPTVWDLLNEDEGTAPAGEGCIKAISKEYRDYYPPEVLDKEAPTDATDIYMAAKCAIALLGGNVRTNILPDSIPAPLVDYIRQCVLPRPSARIQDAWEAEKKFKDIMKALVGKPTFRNLEMRR